MPVPCESCERRQSSVTITFEDGASFSVCEDCCAPAIPAQRASSPVMVRS